MLLTVASEYKISAYVSNENGYDDEAIELGYVIDQAFKAGICNGSGECSNKRIT